MKMEVTIKFKVDEKDIFDAAYLLRTANKRLVKETKEYFRNPLQMINYITSDNHYKVETKEIR